jgi:hypothetical protein
MRLEEPLLEELLFGATGDEVATLFAGVEETTFVAAREAVGTGGTTKLVVGRFATFLATPFFAAAFFATFLAGAFFATFLVADFLATDFFAVFFALAFLAVFLTAVFFTATYLLLD